MTRKLALVLAFASCSSDSSDDGTPNLPITPQQSEQQESQAQKTASESYKIGDTTYIVENGKVTITNTDGSKKEVGSISSDGVITITQGGTTTKISTAKAENGSITTSVAIETKNADGTIVTKTYTGNLNNGTLTNKDNPNDTLTIKKTDSAQAADNTKKPAEDTESKPAEATANQTAADAVIAKISSIGTVTYTAEIKAKIDEVRAAYNALSEAQKALVSAETLALLTNAESTYNTQKAAAME